MRFVRISYKITQISSIPVLMHTMVASGPEACPLIVARMGIGANSTRFYTSIGDPLHWWA